MLTAAIVALFALISGNLFAQTKRDIAIAYNAALKLDSTDHAAALNKMFDVLGMCKTLGTEADDLNKMSRAVIQQIPNSLAKDKKYDDAFTALNLTIAYAEKNNDAEMKEKAQKQMPKFYAAKGQEQMKAEDTDGAIVSFEKASSLDPTFTRAFYNAGIAYKKKDDVTNMQKAMDKTIELASKENDTVTVGKAKEQMTGILLSHANKSMSTGKFGPAIEMAGSSLKYSTTRSNAYLILAISYNNTSKFDLAIEAANKGLSIEPKPEKQQDFYLELGKSYEGKKDIPNACTNYKKITSGANKAAASVKLTNLKCK